MLSIFNFLIQPATAIFETCQLCDVLLYDFDFDENLFFYVICWKCMCRIYRRYDAVMVSSENILVGKKIRTVITFIVANIKAFSCQKSLQHQS